MFSFTPDESKAIKVPYFEDATREEGWQGYRTTKSTQTLQGEISRTIGRLGGHVSGFRSGLFLIDKLERDGFQVDYFIQTPVGAVIPARLDIAALPVRARYNKERREKSICMALYMLRVGLEGMWFMQQLSPGYAPLMPWMLADGERTVSQMWAESSIMSNLLPPPQSEFVDAEIIG